MTAGELYNWRMKHGMTQKTASQMLGRSRVMLSHYEGGIWAVPESVAHMCSVIDKQVAAKHGNS